jgi:hypothetical protein
MKLFRNWRWPEPVNYHQSGDTFVKTKFAWWPVDMGDHYIWLERYYVEYYYCYSSHKHMYGPGEWIVNRKWSASDVAG